jgi:hypothetical protein
MMFQSIGATHENQFLWQASLPGSRSCVRFGRGPALRRPESCEFPVPEGTPYLGEPRAIDRLTGFPGEKEMAGTITVERAKRTFVLGHCV